MGVPVKSVEAGEQAVAAEALFSSFKTIGDEERSRHSAVYDYWLAIRGDREFPSIRDLDPLQISDAGPCSLLLELISGGEDAEIRHIGETLKADVKVVRIVDAPRSSLLSCIARKLAIVAISSVRGRVRVGLRNGALPGHFAAVQLDRAVGRLRLWLRDVRKLPGRG